MAESEQRGTELDAQGQAKQRLAQSNFGAVAGNYVTSKVHASGPDLDWLVEAAALTGGERVLDVATGGGHAAFALAPFAAEVVALDLTRPMLEVAQQEAHRRGLSNIRYLEGDAQSLPCAEASFDVVACRHASHHFPRIDRAAREWARVLKPGGRLLLVDSTSPEEPEADALLHEIEILRDPSHVRNHPIAEWTTLLSETGLVVQSAREWGLFLDIPSWTQRMRTPPAVIARIEELLHSAAPAVRQHLGIEERAGTLGFTLPVALILATKSA